MPLTPILIVESSCEVGPNQGFRLTNDPEHVIRINQDFPDGYESCVDECVAVAGISQPDYARNAAAFMAGSDRRLELEHDPQNFFDRNAIIVRGFWRDESDSLNWGQLGWLPREVAAAMKKYRETDLVARIEVMFLPAADRSAGMRIEIGCPANAIKKRRKKSS